MTKRSTTLALLVSCLLVLSAASSVAASGPDFVTGEQKISALAGGFGGVLHAGDQFGRSVANMGDLDGDGVNDLAVGAFEDSSDASAQGSVWILFLKPDGTVKTEQKIATSSGGFGGSLGANKMFGSGVANIGDVDGDGVTDLGVGAAGGFASGGAAWVVFLNSDGTVKAEQQIAQGVGGFAGTYGPDDHFGVSVAGLGDLNRDGTPDLAIGEWLDDDGGPDRGAVWIVLLKSDGTVKAEQKVSATHGGFTGGLDDGDLFGISVAGLGDLNGDWIPDLAVGAHQGDDGGSDRGAAWVLFMRRNGTVKAQQKISQTAGGFGGSIPNTGRFAGSLAGLGDVDGDAVPDLAAGTFNEPGLPFTPGQVWVLLLDPNGTVKDEIEISTTAGGFGGAVDGGDRFGGWLAALADLNGDGIGDLVVGANLDGDGGFRAGSIWVVVLQATCDGKVATVVGTPGHDILNGGRGADVIAGLAGNDVLRGWAGDDVMCGGLGRDIIRGYAGADTLYGGPWKDRLMGGSGDDGLFGGPGSDRLRGGSGTDICDGGRGFDLIRGCET